MSWQPTATIDTLKQRAAIIHRIRQFFATHDVMEVETPSLSQYTVTDVHIDSFHLANSTPTYHLQTSPEYAMKRLLVAGSGAIYQISKAFRCEEQGSQHNPEFTLLEWYRPGFTHLDLMDDVDALLQHAINTKPATKITYHDIFQQHFNIDPHTCDTQQLQQLTQQRINITHDDTLSRDDYLNLLLTHCIEPTLGIDAPVFIYDYPATQAALAKIRNGKPSVAERFELYFKGTELANGFHELQDPTEQEQRFKQDQRQRQKQQQNVPETDVRFIAALHHGLPGCAGVALGIDRLIMLACSKKTLSETLSFNWNNA